MAAKHVTVGVVGITGSGKSRTLNSLFQVGDIARHRGDGSYVTLTTNLYCARREGQVTPLVAEVFFCTEADRYKMISRWVRDYHRAAAPDPAQNMMATAAQLMELEEARSALAIEQIDLANRQRELCEAQQDLTAGQRDVTKREKIVAEKERDLAEAKKEWHEMEAKRMQSQLRDQSDALKRLAEAVGQNTSAVNTLSEFLGSTSSSPREREKRAHLPRHSESEPSIQLKVFALQKSCFAFETTMGTGGQWSIRNASSGRA
ncbi:hypothetical protein TI39_contig897g00001 [Zymoseptoria brevis]|uniref:G domain-containing protein n=1 Tax=Zymoseptoria brevis TaxID=1047168 RepID=A0A0F4GFZ1_9PEZI|nr:hypothetical protein TI39_contig897g00001 [Zymoseptoria brevis]